MSDADMNTAANPHRLTEEFWEAAAASPNVMISLNAEHGHAVPMRMQLDEDANGAVWFYTSRDNRLAPGGAAMMQFASKGHDLFACVSGTLHEETNPAVIDKHWSNAAATWYEHGRQDPSLLMLRMDLDSAEVWEAKLGIKGMFKMITGITMTGDEMGEHTKVAL